MTRAGARSGLDAEALASLGSMEGLAELPSVETAPPKAGPPPAPVWRGYLLGLLVAAAAYAVHYLPFAPFQIVSESGTRRPISAAILAILLGVVVRNAVRVDAATLEGCKAVVKRVIPVTIVLTGAGLNLALIANVGLRAFLITLLCLAISVAAAYYLGRALKLWPRTAVLIGAGTAVCGNSAIVAVAPLIEANDEDVMLSMGTVNLLGLILMFLFPLAGGLLQLDDRAYGVWTGTSIHAVPQVVTAGFAYSREAGTIATLVKLVRVAMLAPFTFVLALFYARRKKTVKVHYARLVPPFIWGFVGAALLNTLGLIPALEFKLTPVLWGAGRNFQLSTPSLLAEAGSLLLTLAMAAMGLEVNLRYLARVGGAALLAGAGAALALCGASLALIRLLL